MNLLKVIIVGYEGSGRIKHLGQGGNLDYAISKTLELIWEDLPGAETEFMRVADQKIEHCLGCGECMETAERAIEGDDLDLLEDKMQWVDIILIGPPHLPIRPSRSYKEPHRPDSRLIQ